MQSEDEECCWHTFFMELIRVHLTVKYSPGADVFIKKYKFNLYIRLMKLYILNVGKMVYKGDEINFIY